MKSVLINVKIVSVTSTESNTVKRNVRVLLLPSSKEEVILKSKRIVDFIFLEYEFLKYAG